VRSGVEVADPQAVRAAWRDLGHQLATKRKAAKLSQQELADRTKYSRSSIANIETGLQHINRTFWEAVDVLLGANGEFLRGYDAAKTLQRSHQHIEPQNPASDVSKVYPNTLETHSTSTPLTDRPKVAPEEIPGAVLTPRRNSYDVESGTSEKLSRSRRTYDCLDALSEPDFAKSEEDIVDVLSRVQGLSRAVDPLVISSLEKDVSAMLEEYETWARGRFTRSLIKKRLFLDELVAQSMQPAQRQRLFRVAGKVSGLLGYVAVGREGFQLARAYCAESFRLAELAEDADLQAWARGMQSFCEYYAGDYEEALAIALDGLSYAGTGPQSVRLAVNGVARSMGKLGDRVGVQRAVDRAYKLLSQNDAPTGLPSSASLGCYSEAQAASNAATAYVSLGDPTRVQEFAALALPDIKRSASPWSQALLKIDVASSMTVAVDADLERASHIVIDALRISSGYPIVSIRRRTLEFIDLAERRWGKIFILDEVREALESWSMDC